MMENVVRLRFLGTGNAFSESGDHNSSHLLEYGEYFTLLDCGPSILQSLYHHGINPNQLTSIYISHLHPDHYIGLLFLGLHHQYISSFSTIPVYGPPGITARVLAAARTLYSPKEVEALQLILQFNEVDTNMKVDFPGGTFEMLPALHQEEARMVIVDMGGSSVGYSGDTSIHLPSLELMFERCDVIIHEATTYDLYVPYHTMLRDLLELDIPESIQLFVTHHDRSVVEWFANNPSPPHIHLARDGDIVELHASTYGPIQALPESVAEETATTNYYQSIVDG